MSGDGELEPPRLVLEAVAPGARLTWPEGLQVGDALLLPPQVHGRWIEIGAGADQDLVLRDEPPGIAGSHCRLTYRDGRYLIQGRLRKEGYALNGVRLNDCTARPLTDGDRVTLGRNVTLRFRLGPGGEE